MAFRVTMTDWDGRRLAEEVFFGKGWSQPEDVAAAKGRLAAKLLPGERAYIFVTEGMGIPHTRSDSFASQFSMRSSVAFSKSTTRKGGAG